jgi:hypothetical protein
MEALVLHSFTTHVRELDALLVRATLEGRGRYVELGREVTASMKRRTLGETPLSPPRADSPPVMAPRPAEERGDGLGLSRLESERLVLMRKHGFSPTACGRDAAYHGNRQNADLHLRQLLCRALTVAAWDTERAVDLLAGGDASYTRERCAARLATFLGKLATRVLREDPAALRAALIEEWKHGADGALRVVEAIRDGRLAVNLSPGADLA